MEQPPKKRPFTKITTQGHSTNSETFTTQHSPTNTFSLSTRRKVYPPKKLFNFDTKEHFTFSTSIGTEPDEWSITYNANGNLLSFSRVGETTEDIETILTNLWKGYNPEGKELPFSKFKQVFDNGNKYKGGYTLYYESKYNTDQQIATPQIIVHADLFKECYPKLYLQAILKLQEMEKQQKSQNLYISV